MLRIDRVEDADRFAALAVEWDALLEASASDGLFLTWEWLHTWWTHLADGRRLFLITLRHGPELVALAPLALVPPRLERLLPFRSLEFLGAGTVGSDYLDLIVRRGWEEEAVQALADHLARERFMLQLGRVPGGRSLARRLTERLGSRGWTYREAPAEVCPFIRLAGHTWESYLASVGAARRHDQRLRTLHRHHSVEFHRVAAAEERAPSLARLVQLHEARWGPRAGSEAFSSSGLLSFHEELTRLALARGWLRLFELRLDGQPAAALYGFRYRDTFSFYQSGFDPAYARYSVGVVTVALTIKSAIEEGAAEYDMLHGDEAYKLRWALEARELARLELYPPLLRGLICRQAVALGSAVRRAARRMLPGTLADQMAAALRFRSPGAEVREPELHAASIHQDDRR